MIRSGWCGRLTAIAVLAIAALAIGPAAAAAADPGRWDFVGRSSIPLEYFQGVTSSPDGDLFFDGINVGLYRSNSQLVEEARTGNAIPSSVSAAPPTGEGYNHIGDITYDVAEGGRILLPLECFYPGTPGGGNTCKTGSIGVVDPNTFAWKYYVKLDTGPIKKAMWAEVSPDGNELWTQGSTNSGANDRLLVYDMADIVAANGVGVPGAAPPITPIHDYQVLPNNSGVTGATFFRGRLYMATSSHTAGQPTDTFRVTSIDPDAGGQAAIAASLRTEIELQVAGESEGLDVFGSLGGVLHWQIQPIPSDLVGQSATYDPGGGSLLSFVPSANPQAADIHDADDDGVADDADACVAQAGGDQPNGCPVGPAPVGDPDRDDVPATADNCTTTPNNFQANADQDSQGDACDADDDGDGRADAADNCQYRANPDQLDTDGDGKGNACEDDDDNDGVVDFRDNCPLTSNPGQADTDGDGIGDACEAITPPAARDTTAPDTTIGKVKVKSPKASKKKGKGKRKGGRRGKATIVFAATEPDATSFDCTLDGKPLRKCSSPLKLKRLKPGRHKVTVAARDASGNADPTPAKAKFKVKKPRKKHQRR